MKQPPIRFALAALLGAIGASALLFAGVSRAQDEEQSDEERQEAIVSGLLDKGGRYEAAGEIESALSVYTAALALAPRDLDARIGLLRTASALAPPGMDAEPDEAISAPPLEDIGADKGALLRALRAQVRALDRSVESIRRRLEVIDRRVVDDDGRAETLVERLEREVQALRRDHRSLEREVDRLRSRIRR